MTSWLNTNVRVDNTKPAIGIKCATVVGWKEITSKVMQKFRHAKKIHYWYKQVRKCQFWSLVFHFKEVQSFCRHFGSNINQPVLFEEDVTPKTKQRCLKIAREGLSKDILHRIDYGKPLNLWYIIYFHHYQYYWRKEELICCATFDLAIVDMYIKCWEPHHTSTPYYPQFFPCETPIHFP